MTQLVSDELWAAFEPLIPVHVKSAKGGRPRKDDRTCLEGLSYVLRCGVPWRLFPDKQFGVSKSVVFARYQAWAAAGVFARTHHAILNALGIAGKVDLSAAVIDSASVRALFGGRTPGRVPWTEAKRAVNAT